MTPSNATWGLKGFEWVMGYASREEGEKRYTSSMSCVFVHDNVKTTGPLTNYLFSKDHFADLGQPRNCIPIEVQTVSLTVMRTPQFPK